MGSNAKMTFPIDLASLKLLYAQEYDIGRQLKALSMVLSFDEGSDGKDRKLRPDELEVMKDALSSLSEICSSIGLDVTQGLAKRLLSQHPQTSSEVEMLSYALSIELQRTLFFHVPHERAKHFEATPDDAIVDGFPGAAKELVRAGNCFAFGEYAACVFHNMRTMEIALKALYRCLGLAPRASSNWGNILREIRGEIQNRGVAFQAASEFLDLAATLAAVKDGWRNAGLHVDASHSEMDAKRIYEAVLHFMGKISCVMDEKGLPRA